MRHKRRAAAIAAAAVLVSPVVAQAATPSAPERGAAAAPTLQPWLEQHLGEVAPTSVLRVMVRGTSEGAAARAAEASGLRVQQSWPLLDAVVAVGAASAVPGLLEQEGVRHVEGDTPLRNHLQTAHVATRSTEAAASFPDVDGTGVSIAVIDSGIDGTHPFFQTAEGSKVVQNRKNACGIDFEIDPLLSETCFVSLPDTDTPSGGGHGTHVAGIAAGVPVTADGRELRGAATGAKLVGLSVGAAIGLLDAVAAQNWVLEHMQNPCRPAAEQTTDVVDPACPPIRVTNHSYGPIASEGEDQVFSADSLAVIAQRAFVARGGVAVWAAGNDGGDGSYAATNPDAMDPTPGVLMVASYDDAGTGTRDNALSTFSSRGKDGAPGTYPDLSAPGDLITSSCRAYLPVCATGFDLVQNGDYNTISGTSMAAPYVAGVVAQLFQAEPSLTPADVERILEDTAYPFASGAPYDASGTSYDKGHGLVDVVAAVAAAKGLAAPPAPAPTTCPVDAAFTDPEGDATRALVDAPLPSDPSLDVVSSRLSTDAATGAVTFTIGLADLTAPTAYGQYFDYNATIGSAGYFLSAQRTVTGAQTFRLGDFSGAGGTRATLATLTGAFDDAADTVTIVLPPTAGTLVVADGTSISGLEVISRRQLDAVAVSAIPDADTATGTCGYVVGAEHDVVVEEPPAECTRPNGKPCKEPKGKGGKG